MNTMTKQSPLRSTDRVLEALSTLAALLDRTINEVQSLDGEFQKRIMQAVHETETSLQDQAASHIEQAVAETRQNLRAELITQLREQFEVEQNAALEAIRREFEAEREKFSRELDRAAHMAAQWEQERARLNSEVESANQTVAQKTEEYERRRAEAEQERERATTAAASLPAPDGAGDDAVINEIRRVENLIQEITDLIDNPATDLSMVIRKNVERAELDSYLRGIRFAFGPKK